MKPTIGRIVHYVSYGTPGGEYESQCRAAVVTAVDEDSVSLAVLNPTGTFFNSGVRYDDGGGNSGDINCPNTMSHGDPFRYCGCGWVEAHHVGGTWHWPER